MLLRALQVVSKMQAPMVPFLQRLLVTDGVKRLVTLVVHLLQYEVCRIR